MNVKSRMIIIAQRLLQLESAQLARAILVDCVEPLRNLWVGHFLKFFSLFFLSKKMKFIDEEMKAGAGMLDKAKKNIDNIYCDESVTMRHVVRQWKNLHNTHTCSMTSKLCQC